jgi:hypothetical protein
VKQRDNDDDDDDDDDYDYVFYHEMQHKSMQETVPSNWTNSGMVLEILEQ